MRPREVHGHETGGRLNAMFEIRADERDEVGCTRTYEIWLGGEAVAHSPINAGEWVTVETDGTSCWRRMETLQFQQGSIGEHGANGITNETLIAILIDRLVGFQAGPFRSEHNERALSGLRLAASALQDRTQERIERGVEGTREP